MLRRARAVLTVAALAASASFAGAEGWEVAVSAGRVVPFYDQAFSYDPGPIAPPLPGITIEQGGAFMLEGHGGLALNAAVARDLGRHLALEARLDTADVSVQTTGARYRVSARLPAPLPPVSSDVDVGTGTVDLERLRPLSLNLKLRAGDKTRVAVSGGLSWLPAFRFQVDQAVGVGLPTLAGGRLSLDVARAGLRAEAVPSQSGQGRLGGNVGVAIAFPLGGRVALLAEGRYFHFQELTLQWGRAETSVPLSAIQETLAREIESRLEPVVFNPTFFHASLGLALRF